MTSLVDAESVLSIDIGSVTTRALLFDVVEGQYHFIAAGVAPSTAGMAYHDIRQGFQMAVKRIQETTGRTLLSEDNQLILPSQPDSSGVDRFALSFSAGDDFHLVVMGLLSDVSLESAERLAASTYGVVVDRIGLTDTRRREEQIDALVKAHPDMIILAGGTEKGATRSVLKQVELISLACKLMPPDSRPTVIYCGNNAISKRVQETLEGDMVVGLAPNIRPDIDLEDLPPARSMVSRAAAKIRARQISGFNELASIASVPLTPGASAFGRIVRFLSQVYDPSKGVLGIDLGAEAITLAVGRAGALNLNVNRSFGMGANLPSLLKTVRPEDILRWIPYPLSAADVRDYIYQKSLYPASLPLTNETLAIEQAAARAILEVSTQQMQDRWTNSSLSFDLIILNGGVLAYAPHPWQSMRMLLDGVQPVGISTCLLDPYGITQALGTVAANNTVLPVQVIDSGIYRNLGTIIAPVSESRPGTPILRIKITFAEGGGTEVEVKQGSLVSLPIGNGQSASLTITPLHNTVIDPARLTLRSFKVIGGLCGVVVDARGRPFALPKENAKRLEILNQWANTPQERMA